MASAEELVFQKSEYQIVEEFEFEEEVQRPEAIRFFTYEEQASDFIEKLLPQTGRIAKAAIRKAEYEVDSFTVLHKRVVEETAEGYTHQAYVRPSTLPWVHYKNTNPLQYTEYTWNQKWSPLFTDGSLRSPNYYLVLLDSLPKSAVYYAAGDGVPVYTNGVTQIENHKFLDRFPYTKINYHEDGTYTTAYVHREETQDVAKFTNYVVDNPPIAPPAPLADHPFLSVHPDPIVIDSTEPLQELLPTMEAIFTHAVPETQKPYTEGLRYLKIYDINLRDVPDKLWTTKFPPEAAVDEMPPPQDLTFPEGQADAPSKNILEAYKTPWYPALSSRKWLNSQVDGGLLVARMILSQAGDVGIAAIPPPVVFPESGVIEGTADDCLPPEITSFDDFLTRGIYRAPKCASCGAAGHPGKSCPDKVAKTDYRPGYGCFPMSFVHNERSDAPYADKSPWTPGTNEQILKDHQQTLQKFKDYYRPAFEKVVPAPPAQSHNETRLMIVSILDDETKTPEDQVYEIEALVKNAPLENHTYLDKDTGAFLVCEHELEILRGSYAKDPQAFLKKWCVRDAGYYVCQYSGERVSDVIEAQDQFDEQGRIMNRHDRIEGGGGGEKGKEHLTFSESLKGLQAAFKTNNPGEDIMYLLLSLIQVIPEDGQLKVYLDYVRRESEKLRSKISGKKLSTKQTADVDMALSIFGFNAIVLLLQTHRPQLIPRRSFGSKPLVLRGFPRDTDDMNDSPLVDSLINALIQTFESYPSTFRGSSVVFLRTLLNDKKATRRVVLSSLKGQFAKEFGAQLAESKDNLDAVAVGYIPVQSFVPSPVLPKKSVAYLLPTESVMTGPELRYTCMVNTPWITPTTRFSFNQEPFVITDTLKPSRKSRQVLPLAAPRGLQIVKADVARRLKLKSDTTKLGMDAKSQENPGVLLNLLLRALNIVAEETVAGVEMREYISEVRESATMSEGEPSLLRDLYKGYIYELGQKLSGNQAVLTQFERSYKADMTVRSLISTAAENRKAVDAHKARERDEFRLRLRRLPDALRDITTKLIDLGLAPYLITKDDREAFMRELQQRVDGDAQPPTDDPLVAPNPPEDAGDIPEEGLNAERDLGADGEARQAGEQELEVDYGDYGDRRARTADGEEAEEGATYED